MTEQSLITNDSGTQQTQQTQDTTQQTQQTTQQQTTQTQAFDHNTWDYKTALPDDLKNEAVFGKYKNLEGVFRGLHSAQKMIGKDPDSLVEIKPNMTAADRRALAARMGLPEKSDGYKFEAPKDAPDWLKDDQPLGKWFKETAHQVGIHPEDAGAIYQGFAKQMIEAAGAQQAAAAAEADRMIGSLKTELGDKFDSTVRAANFAVKTLGGKELVEALNGADLGVHPAVIKAFAKVGEMLAEGNSGGDKPNFDGDALGGNFKKQAMDKIAESHQPKYDRDPIGKKRLQEEAAALFAKAEAASRS